MFKRNYTPPEDRRFFGWVADSLQQPFRDHDIHVNSNKGIVRVHENDTRRVYEIIVRRVR